MGEFPWGHRAPDRQVPRNPCRDRTPVGLSSGLGLRAEQLASLAALFPQARIEVVEPAHALQAPDLAVAVVAVPVADAARLAGLLKARACGPKLVVALEEADLSATRALMAAGAADVLHPPLTETALTLSLDRVFGSLAPRGPRSAEAGQIVALLKAGGGVGATSLGVQAAAMLAQRGERVCVADLDIQFGAAALFLDVPDALTVSDCLAAGEFLAETAFAERLGTHRSGARLLAAPVDVAPLEALDVTQVEALVRALRQEMALTIVDLPSDWTAWTNHLLHQADRIVLVTRLTVAHLQAAKRQLRMLSNQALDGAPLTLVCNAVTSEQQQALGIKAAERALGRSFDIIIPSEERLMLDLGNQGLQLEPRGRSAKLYKCVAALADTLSVPATAPARG